MSPWLMALKPVGPVHRDQHDAGLQLLGEDRIVGHGALLRGGGARRLPLAGGPRRARVRGMPGFGDARGGGTGGADRWRAPAGPLLAGVDAIDAASLTALLGRPVDADRGAGHDGGDDRSGPRRLEGEGLPATARS